MDQPVIETNADDRDSAVESASARAAQPRSPRVSWTIVNFWLDALLLVLFLSLLWCSAILRFLFPPGTAAAGWRLWGLGFDRWSEVQFGLLCVLAAAVLVHVMLHWSWVCGVVFRRLLPVPKSGPRAAPDEGVRTLVGVGLLIVLLNVMGAAIAAAALSITAP